ncbi:hypothetical protein TFLX_01665 [Thermoflexales bacterium]|nr:hypothetical protein TFLX_01665 [Thermoflexales bacterium]
MIYHLIATSRRAGLFLSKNLPRRQVLETLIARQQKHRSLTQWGCSVILVEGIRFNPVTFG